MDNPKEKYPDVFDYILTQETAFQTTKISLAPNWEWSMYEHLNRSYMLKNSQFTLGNNDYTRPFNNIILPIANVNYRTEGFDVKNIEVYVDDSDNYHLSLYARKFHNRWARANGIDTAIDETVESYFDYGLALVKNTYEERPEVVDLKTIAFCSQQDIMRGPICLKHSYTIDELVDMKDKWYADQIDIVIHQATFSTKTTDSKENATPSKNIDVYELHGVFPTNWLEDDEAEDNGEYSRQIHLVAYYKNPQGQKGGVCLYKAEIDQIFKALKRDPISGRACGRGGIEELFHPQIWTNYSEIHLQQMLEATSKVILQTSDKKLATANKLTSLKHGQILYHEANMPVSQLPIQPLNKVAYDGFINKWEQVARTIGSASDPQLGLNPTSGTPLGTTQIVTSQGEGVHDYRQGKVAVFWGEIYDEWVTKYMTDALNKGDKWLEDFSIDELQELAQNVATNVTNERIADMIFNGHQPTNQERDALTEIIKQEFMKGGRKHFMEVMKDEFKKLPLKVHFDIAGKQKNLADTVNKLNSIFRGIFANPAILQVPGMGELFNEILESSGLSPLDFSAITKPVQQQAVPNTEQLLPSSIQISGGAPVAAGAPA